MPKVSPLQESFNAGEVSPLVYGRVSSERYKAAMKVCLNYIPTIQGPLIRRSGSSYISSVKDPSKLTRLVAFEFSTTQAYILEFSNNAIRFYKNNGAILETSKVITAATRANPAVITSVAHGFANGDQVEIEDVVGMTQLNGRRFTVANVAADTFELSGVNSTAYTAYASGGTASRVYTVTSTYTEAELFQLKFTQSADVLYIVHPSHAPMKLSRTGHTSWTLAAIDFLDGPYLPVNSTTTTLTASATTGNNITITASTAIFNATTDVGRLIRLKVGSTWGYVKLITDAGNSTTVMHADVKTTLGGTTATAVWRLGLYSATSGYPGAVVFHEDRLFLAGAAGAPQRFDGSNTSDYENFAPTDASGTVVDSNAVGFSLNSNDVNVIRWMTSDEKGLLLGTVAGEWVARPSAQSEAISPTNIAAKRATGYGSANLQPVQSGKATIFITRAGKKVRELAYFYDVDGFRANDVTALSPHIAGDGFIQLAAQKEPQSLIWGVRSDGILACMTYERDIDAVKVGWSRHIVGGSGDAADAIAAIESVAVIPSPDGTHDDVWIIVQRWVNGAIVRYVEVLERFFDELDEQKDAFFVDCGLSYDDPIDITAITKANPGVVTAAAHGLSNGDHVLIAEVAGMTQVNGTSFKVANKAPNTFELQTLAGVNVNTSAYDTYVSGGEVRAYVTHITGLAHLEGETVDVFGDGAVQPSQVVTAGEIELATTATTVHIGLNMHADGQLLRLDAGAADGTSIGKTRRTHVGALLVHRLLGLKYGFDFDDLDTLTFRRSSDSQDRAVPLVSGVLPLELDADYDTENEFCWRQDTPLPGTILAVMPQMVTQDR